MGGAPKEAGATSEQRCLRPTPSSRGHRQREVDKVDIPAPAEWLCHDAAASTKLRDQAQTELQVLVPRRPTHLPHSERQEVHIRERDAGLVAAIRSTVGNRWSKARPREMRPGRVLCGGEILPWGVWPARLRHLEGQSFYEEDGKSDAFGDGGGVTRPNRMFLVGGASVGRGGGVGGVGSVNEGSIHDELFRRQFPSSSASRSSTHYNQHQYRHHHHYPEETAVTRLLPDKRGRWAEVTARGLPPSGAASLPEDVLAGSDGSAGRPPSPPPPPETPAPEPAPAAAGSGEVVKSLIPGRYGGWVEIEEKATDRTRDSNVQRQRRRAAATRTARFGPDDGGGGGGGVPDAALPSSYLEEERYVRRMVAKVATAAAATVAGEAQQQRQDGGSQQQQRQEEEEHETRVGTTMDSSVGQGGDGGLGDGGGSWRSGVALEGAAAVQRENNGDSVAGDDKDHGSRRRGWTVSEPAKEAVRRVWNRATRRARDSYEPRLQTSRASIGVLEDGSAASDRGATRENLDADLLSCLGRECEGIIDAALHVVLGDRLRLLGHHSSSAAASSAQEKHNSKPPPPPPPLETADWQDVLRAMRSCSQGARGVRTTAAIATVAARGNGEGQPSPFGATTERGAGEAVPGREQMERTVWGAGDLSDGSVVVVNERLPGLPLNEAVLTRAYNRLLLYLHEKKTWHA